MERRLAAIMAADVVGYSRLIRDDEEGTISALKALRADFIDPKLSEHNGRIVKLMGDGMLAEFPSVLDAVRAAVETQQAVTEHNSGQPEGKQIQFRVGINLGDVVIDGDDIHGDGVNVAARLEGLAETGGVCISGMVYEGVRDRIEYPFEDLGEQEIKNIDRPVRVWRWVSGGAPTAAAPERPDAARFALPEKPSIAVLPFDNLSGDPEQEFFADGMAEDIITSLSRYRSLFVIARNSTFAYKGQSPDLRELSRDLGVRYVMEGSVRKGGPRIRVTAQLIEGATGNHIWAKRYDRELDDIFAVQDEITQAIVAAIGPEINQAERERAQRLAPESLAVWECYQRGLWHLYRFNREDNAEARQLFKRAVAATPDFAPGQSGLTHALYYSFMHGYAEDPAATLAEAYDAGRQAITSDERDADAHFALGRILYLRHDLDDSIAELEEAIAQNPSFAHAHFGLGTALIFAGEFERAIECCDRAARLSPNDPLLWLAQTLMGTSLLCARRYEDAEQALRQATRHPNAAWTTWLFLASVLGHLGETARAGSALAEVLGSKPDLDAEHLRRILPFRDSAHYDTVIDGLRKAGFTAA
jgi:adenylate cyclase